jgi:glycosyltransferase involved in cell wall biosynthesis
MANQWAGRILIVHEGRRDNYEIAKAFKQHGAAVTLVTTGYSTAFLRRLAGYLRSRKLKKLAARHSPVLEGAEIIGLFWTELAAKCMKAIFGESFASEWLNVRISNAANKRVAQGDINLILCYNYNAFMVFNNENARSIKKVLFQCHPHPISIRETFEEYGRLGYVSLKNGEKEFAYSDEYLAMLIAEPFLADKVLCASTYTKRSLLRAGLKNGVVQVIPYGIDAARPRKIGTVESNENKKVRILFVGQFVYRKGLKIVSDILNRLDFDVVATFVGRGNREISPAQLVSNPLVETRVLWDVPDSDLDNIYRESDIFLFPSIVEGFGQVVLEAMARGCIPLVSENTCGPDVIESGASGFVIRASDVDEYRECIKILRDGKRRAEMSKAAVEKAAQFSWTMFGDLVVKEALC